MTRTAIGTVCSDEQAEVLNRELGLTHKRPTVADHQQCHEGMRRLGEAQLLTCMDACQIKLEAMTQEEYEVSPEAEWLNMEQEAARQEIGMRKLQACEDAERIHRLASALGW